ncbi:hypothetical protein K2X40_03725 [Candidatus Babeliales bacterium]|nr:hypothetical protein [Candidatus Babeliales bacterium]
MKFLNYSLLLFSLAFGVQLFGASSSSGSSSSSLFEDDDFVSLFSSLTLVPSEHDAFAERLVDFLQKMFQERIPSTKPGLHDVITFLAKKIITMTGEKKQKFAECIVSSISFDKNFDALEQTHGALMSYLVKLHPNFSHSYFQEYYCSSFLPSKNYSIGRATDKTTQISLDGKEIVTIKPSHHISDHILCRSEGVYTIATHGKVISLWSYRGDLICEFPVPLLKRAQSVLVDANTGEVVVRFGDTSALVIPKNISFRHLALRIKLEQALQAGMTELVLHDSWKEVFDDLHPAIQQTCKGLSLHFCYVEGAPVEHELVFSRENKRGKESSDSSTKRHCDAAHEPKAIMVESESSSPSSSSSSSSSTSKRNRSYGYAGFGMQNEEDFRVDLLTMLFPSVPTGVPSFPSIIQASPESEESDESDDELLSGRKRGR